jgi:hypothetical protein
MSRNFPGFLKFFSVLWQSRADVNKPAAPADGPSLTKTMQLPAISDNH